MIFNKLTKKIYIFPFLFLIFTYNVNINFSKSINESNKEEKIIETLECLKQQTNILFEKEKEILLLKEKINILKKKNKLLNKKVKILNISHSNVRNKVAFDPFFLINSGANFYSKEPIPFIGLSIGIIFRGISSP